MTIHTIEKPTLFISHATSDAQFALAVQREVEKTFANGVSVFCTSSPGMIASGTDWLADVETTLERAKAVVAIVTPVSIERPWLWFEIGATWLKSRGGECKIYPLCAPEIELSTLPSPLDRLQALSMGRAQDLKLLFEALMKQFGFGNISAFRASNISKRIPKYKDVEIAEPDRNDRGFYSGRYNGYSDLELMEVIDASFLRPDKVAFETFGVVTPFDREALVHLGKLVHFQNVDSELQLPPGTSKRLLKMVAKRYDLIPTLESDNIIRFAPKEFASKVLNT